MLFLRVYASAALLGEVAQGLEDHGSARHVVVAPGVRSGHALLTAELHPDSADPALEFLVSSGVEEDAIALARLDEIAPVGSAHPATSLIWADVLGQARRNARPVALYLAFAIAAGVIAAFGVIEVNTILIVGAMAISPDMLPLSAACVGLVSRTGRLVRRALVTLFVGLGTSCVAATLVAVVLDLTDLMPADFVLNGSALGGLTTVNAATVGVAFAAGVAGILALETRASSAVGVAISVTTIPAAAYLGVAVGVWRDEQGVGCTGGAERERGGAIDGWDADAPRSAALGPPVDEIGDVVQVGELMPENGQTPDAPASPDATAILRSRAFVGLLVLAAVAGLVASVAAWGFLELVHQVQVGRVGQAPGLGRVRRRRSALVGGSRAHDRRGADRDRDRTAPG